MPPRKDDEFLVWLVRAIHEEEEVQSALTNDEIFNRLYEKMQQKWQRELWKKTLALMGILIPSIPLIRDFLNYLSSHFHF